jgi:hypothetical protein
VYRDHLRCTDDLGDSMSDPVFKYRLNQECLSPMIRWGLERIRRVYPGVVVTSTNEPVDGRLINSKHYNNPCDAIDLALETRFGKEVHGDVIKEAIGKGFDVVQKTTHIHVEFDPKE